MDRRELAGDPVLATLLAFQGLQSEMWTALPGIVIEFNPEMRTCSIQPAIQAGIPNPETGEREWVNMPILLDCPVVFPGGGGYLLTFPLMEGDEVLVVFSSRCIDGWWESGELVPQMELRMHDLSDGFCIPGIESTPKVSPAISPTDVQLRSKEGDSFVSLGPEGVNVMTAMPVTITSATTIALVAPLITANGVPIP